MNKWLVVHSIESYSQYSDMIGCNFIQYRNKKIPKIKKSLEIKKGDLVVYYAKGKKIVGLFEIMSDIFYLSNDPYWGNTAVYKISPIYITEAPLSFDKLIHDPKINFDLFKNKKHWGTYLQGKSIIKLTKNDFNIFFKFIKHQSS